MSRKFREDRFKQVVVLYQEEMQRISTIAGKNEKLSLSIKRSFIGNARYCMQLIYHNMPFLVACRMISEICQNEELQKVLVEYPWKKNPLKLRIFCAGMKYKMSVLLYVLLACRG